MARTKPYVNPEPREVEPTISPTRAHATQCFDSKHDEIVDDEIEDECPNIEGGYPVEPAARVLDRLRGFAYLESFEELRAWYAEDVDPLARSNVPMPDRQLVVDPASEASSKVMLIYDYQGGYNRYEACQGMANESDMYSCEYLQHVETFVYFSHKLVTIPPPTWINTCHRNGVYCLGTFIVEPGTKGAECILEEDALGGFWVAHQLAEIAKKYCFDGWLVNIEESFPLLTWSVERMESFLKRLRRELGINRRVVWYDALTTLNFVWYQNTLNSLNLVFALAAGSILTNYAWNPTLAKSAHHLARSSGLGSVNVYFGIDMWAQNAQTGRHRRVTFPVKGGGGTGTGLGLGSLKELGLNAGIFAPGWSFEHFQTSKSRAIQRSVWLGKDLPLGVACECLPEHPHECVSYRQNGIVEHARRYPSGSRTFFHTDFTRGLTPTADNAFFAHIGAQSVLPLPSTAGLKSSLKNGPGSSYREYDRDLSAEVSGAPSRLVVSIHKSQEPVVAGPVSALLHLFDLCISSGNIYELSVYFRHLATPACTTLMLAVQYSGQHDHFIELPNGNHIMQTIKAQLPTKEEYITGIFLNITCEDDTLLPDIQFNILEISSITIQPSGSDRSCEITNLRLEERGKLETRHHRLVWEIDGYEHGQAGVTSEVPFSAITGPCAYFTVDIDGSPAGRACALEFVVPGSLEMESSQETTTKVEITAIGFDGQTMANTVEILHWPSRDEGWVWITPEHFA